MRVRCWRISSPGTWWGTCRRCSGWPMPTAGTGPSGTSGYEESARYVEEQLRAAGYAPVRQTFTFKEDGRRGKTVESFNILADTGGDAGHTVVVGAHLDSVQEGPGINDNGSGVAAVLETARWMKEAGITPANRVRFAFWGGEEDGLYGSQHYVDELSAAEIGQTAANLNVDMVASPNGVRSVHDGDGRISATPARPGPRRSRTSSSATSRRTRCRPRPRPLTAAPTTTPSSRPAFPAAGCSPAMRRGRPRPRPSPMAGRPARTSIPATTRPATPSPTPTRNCSPKCPAPWPTAPWPTRWPRPAKHQLRLSSQFAVPFAVPVGRGSRMSMAPAPMSTGCPAAGIFPSSPGPPKVMDRHRIG